MGHEQKMLGTILLILLFFCLVSVNAQDWSQCGSNADDILIASVNSLAPIQNNPTSPSTFTLTDIKTITLIRTYHWNYGSGQDPGTGGKIRIFKDNLLFSELDVNYLETTDGVQYAYWVACGATPNRSGPIECDYLPPLSLSLGPGTYTILDSDKSTWSQNDETGGKGIFFVYALR
jgi:hypothetical protein